MMSEDQQPVPVPVPVPEPVPVPVPVTRKRIRDPLAKHMHELKWEKEKAIKLVEETV